MKKSDEKTLATEPVVVNSLIDDYAAASCEYPADDKKCTSSFEAIRRYVFDYLMSHENSIPKKKQLINDLCNLFEDTYAYQSSTEAKQKIIRKLMPLIITATEWFSMNTPEKTNEVVEIKEKVVNLAWEYRFLTPSLLNSTFFDVITASQSTDKVYTRLVINYLIQALTPKESVSPSTFAYYQMVMIKILRLMLDKEDVFFKLSFERKSVKVLLMRAKQSHCETKENTVVENQIDYPGAVDDEDSDNTDVKNTVICDLSRMLVLCAQKQKSSQSSFFDLWKIMRTGVDRRLQKELLLENPIWLGLLPTNHALWSDKDFVKSLLWSKPGLYCLLNKAMQADQGIIQQVQATSAWHRIEKDCVDRALAVIRGESRKRLVLKKAKHTADDFMTGIKSYMNVQCWQMDELLYILGKEVADTMFVLGLDEIEQLFPNTKPATVRHILSHHGNDYDLIGMLVLCSLAKWQWKDEQIVMNNHDPNHAVDVWTASMTDEMEKSRFKALFFRVDKEILKQDVLCAIAERHQSVVSRSCLFGEDSNKSHTKQTWIWKGI